MTLKKRKVKIRSKKLDNFRNDAMIKHILLDSDINRFLSIFFTDFDFHIHLQNLILFTDSFGVGRKIGVIRNIFKTRIHKERIKSVFDIEILKSGKEVKFKKSGYSANIKNFLKDMEKINILRNHLAHEMVFVDYRGKPIETPKLNPYSKGDESDLENARKNVDRVFKEFLENKNSKYKKSLVKA